ncbi:tyrosine-type recombinase/integrase [Lampropedia cohaerens]|nr:tyrosine-type recombinase/integrase [Lampropedia cohaerens]
MPEPPIGKVVRMYQKGKTWYHVTAGRNRIWTPLSEDKQEALILWAQVEAQSAQGAPDSLANVVQRYMREVMPKKAARTRKDNEAEVPNLLRAFGAMRVGDIQPFHVRRYMDARGEQAPVRANREKALLSHIFNKAREWGYTNAANPCQGVRGFREAGRSRYVQDHEFKAVKRAAKPVIADAMDLAYLTAQRPADLLKMRWSDIYRGALHVRQNKTGALLSIEVSGDLADVLERIKLRRGQEIGEWLLQREDGQPLSYPGLFKGFEKARKAAGVFFQFRDIRAKAATDLGDLAHAQQLLGHSKRDMTEHYVRSRQGVHVAPLRLR